MMKKKILIASVAGFLVLAAAVWALFFSAMSSGATSVFVDIDEDDNIDSVLAKVGNATHAGMQLKAFKALASVTGYAGNIRTGHYEITPSTGCLRLLRNMKNGLQKPIRITIPTVRTNERLAAELGKRLMLDSTDFIELFKDSSRCAEYGCDTFSIMGLFIPNTYEMYWNIPLDRFMLRIKKESTAFWTPERLKKAEASSLTPLQVVTLASIIDEETANNAEKPDIAAMSLNRLRKGMPLQADPTIKFATRQFQLRRIYHNMLFVKSPYNTYKNTGLPPGPIRIPSVAGIDAVLNNRQHDYLYMCAKEDFSGTHRFARTYSEHLTNAKRYTDALNRRAIK